MGPNLGIKGRDCKIHDIMYWHRAFRGGYSLRISSLADNQILSLQRTVVNSLLWGQVFDGLVTGTGRWIWVGFRSFSFIQLFLGTRWWLRSPAKNHPVRYESFPKWDILHIIWRRVDFSSSGGKFFEKKWNHHLGFMVVLITVSKNLLLSLAWPMFHSCHRFGSSSPGSWHVHLRLFKDRNLFIKRKLQEKKPFQKSQFLEEKKMFLTLSQAMDVLFFRFCLLQSDVFQWLSWNIPHITG